MRVVWFAAVMAMSMNVMASDVNANTDKQALQQLLEQTKSLSAKFEQKVKDEQDNVLQTLGGKMKLKRPANLYWHTLSPDETVMVANGEKVWYYNPFVDQVTVYAQQDMVDNSPLLLVLDSNTNQWQNYSVGRVDDRYLVRHNSDNSQLELVFDGNSLKEITLVQAHGERTEIMLEDVVLNAQIDDQQFTFKVPAGVDVDDQS